MLKVIRWGLLGDQLGKKEGLKDVRIGSESESERRNNLASEMGHIKHTEQYQAPRGTGNLTREMRSWSGDGDW